MDMFRAEQPYEDVNNIRMIGGGSLEDAEHHLDGLITEEMKAQFRLKAAEIASGNPLDNEDCEECEMMGAIGVQMAYMTRKNETTADPNEEWLVLKLCAPCTLRVTTQAAGHIREARRTMRRYN